MGLIYLVRMCIIVYQTKSCEPNKNILADLQELQISWASVFSFGDAHNLTQQVHDKKKKKTLKSRCKS